MTDAFRVGQMHGGPFELLSAGGGRAVDLVHRIYRLRALTLDVIRTGKPKPTVRRLDPSGFIGRSRQPGRQPGRRSSARRVRTTLLRMAAGLEEITYGVIRIGGRMVKSHTTQMRHELWANVGPQQARLDNELLGTWAELESIGRRPLVLGIRSEDLGGVARTTGRPDRLRATVELREILGRDAYLYLALEGTAGTRVGSIRVKASRALAGVRRKRLSDTSLPMCAFGRVIWGFLLRPGAASSTQ
jgi:hypothetical protein